MKNPSLGDTGKEIYQTWRELMAFPGEVVEGIVTGTGTFSFSATGDIEVLTATQVRTIINVEDGAEAMILATEKYNKPDPVNLGSGVEISIKDLVGLICKLMDFKGEIHWDATKPDGQPRRRLDVSKAEKEFDFQAKTNFEQGLKKTIQWYIENPNQE